MLKIGDYVDAIDMPACHAAPAHVDRWVLLRVNPTRDGAVASSLWLRGLSCYRPVYHRSIAIGRSRRRTVETSLFPGLLFVPTFDADLARLRAAPGVIDFLRFDDVVATLGPSLMDDVRLIASVLAMPQVERRRVFAKGEAVRIVDGPLSGFVGRIERLDGRGRIRVLIEAIKRGVAVSVTDAQIEPA